MYGSSYTVRLPQTELATVLYFFHSIRNSIRKFIIRNAHLIFIFEGFVHFIIFMIVFALFISYSLFSVCDDDNNNNAGSENQLQKGERRKMHHSLSHIAHMRPFRSIWSPSITTYVFYRHSFAVKLRDTHNTPKLQKQKYTTQISVFLSRPVSSLAFGWLAGSVVACKRTLLSIAFNLASRSQRTGWAKNNGQIVQKMRYRKHQELGWSRRTNERTEK